MTTTTTTTTSTIRSSSSPAWRCEPPASMLGATWSKSCSRPSPSFVASLSRLVHCKPALPWTRPRISQDASREDADARHTSRSDTLGDGLPLLWSKPVVQIRIVFSRGECELRDELGSFHSLLDDLWDAPVHETHGSLLLHDVKDVNHLVDELRVRHQHRVLMSLDRGDTGTSTTLSMNWTCGDSNVSSTQRRCGAPSRPCRPTPRKAS